MIALIGITIERNVISSSRNASPSTNANTSGRCVRIRSLKSRLPAVSPPTATSTPGTSPIVAGMISLRSRASAS